MNHELVATVISSSSLDSTTRTIVAVVILTIITLAFPLAKRWADGPGARRATLSIQPRWELKQGKRVLASFDDQVEANREFTRRITTHQGPTT